MVGLKYQAVVVLATLLLLCNPLALAEEGSANTIGRVAVFQASLGERSKETRGASQDSGEDSQKSSDQADSAHKRLPSPSQQAMLQDHWWNKEETLNLVLMDSEAEFKRNLEKEKEVEGKGNPMWARDSPPPGAPPGPSPFTYMDRKFIANYPCAYESRLGAWGDGGKWICFSHFKSKNPNPVVTSIGSNGDTSFEQAIHDTIGVSTHTFDFSLKPKVAETVSNLDYIHFHPFGLTGKRDWEAYTKAFKKQQAQFLTFPELLKTIGETYIDIFKVDCEFCEYELVKDMSMMYTREDVPIGQVQFELHQCDNITRTNELFDALYNLGFRMFHTEINLYGAGFRNWQFEVALIHESLVTPRN